MIIYTKELKYKNSDFWEHLETIRSKDSYVLDVAIARDVWGIESCTIPGDSKEYFRGSKVAVMFSRFYNPKAVAVISCKKFSALEGVNWERVNSIIGCWPFDYMDFLQIPEDVESMEEVFGVVDYRIVAYKE